MRLKASCFACCINRTFPRAVEWENMTWHGVPGPGRSRGRGSCYFKRVPFGARVDRKWAIYAREVPRRVHDRHRDASRARSARDDGVCVVRVPPELRLGVPHAGGRRHGAPDGLLAFAYHQLPPLIPRPPPGTFHGVIYRRAGNFALDIVTRLRASRRN